MSAQQQDETLTGLEIAVIGMSGRFPGAKNIEEFWNNLKNGVESIAPVSDEELREGGIGDELINHPEYIKFGAFLEDIECFDADFFDYPLLDAKIMDPQVRIFHECVWEALENAGYSPKQYKGTIGLYAGASPNLYWENLALFSDINASLGLFTTTLSSDKDFLTTRIAYKLNLRGPSFALSSACSTSLLAIHLACQGLLDGECSLAVAGGVSVTLPKRQGYFYQEHMILSPDGHCRAFDEKAQGTVFGQGVGAVVLKPLEDAITDGDYIYAVIKGTAINNDGNRKVAYSAPSPKGQAIAIKTALRVAEVAPESISYIETHGTATEVGDPIEIEALTLAFDTEKKGFCRIGSLKPNIGHLYVAAGVASFIKTALALYHKQLPPSINFDSPNPKIDFENSPFFVNTQLTEWKRDGYPLRAGVSSFAIGGTNVHVVLEEAPKRIPFSEGRQWKLLILSAKTEKALEHLSANLITYLQNTPNVSLADAAYTLQVGREPFSYRRKVLCSTVGEAISGLSQKKNTSPGRASGYMRPLRSDNALPSVVFMFAGQGSQYVNMGVALYQQEQTFREELDRCFAILHSIVDYNIKDLLYPSSSQEFHAKEKIMQTAVAQPLIFAFEYALAKLLMQWGIRPEAMIGYSFGEYVVACLAGVFSLEDALMLTAMRGKLMNRLPPGAMVSVPLPEEEVLPLLHDELSLAIVNGPSCIVAGSEKAIKTFEQFMQQKRYMTMRVSVSFAAHSTEMEAVLAEFEEYAQKVTFHKPEIPYISSITGTWITEEQATDPTYWASHMRSTIRFSAGIEQMVAEIPHSIFLEIGPGRDLSVVIGRFIEENAQQRILSTIRNPQKKVSDGYFLLNQLGKLWGAGVPIDWNGFYTHEQRQRIPLPTYPFERQYHWIDESTQQRMHELIDTNQIFSMGQLSTVRKKELTEWFYIPSWRQQPLVTRTQSQERSQWLIFLDEGGIGECVAKSLETAGHEVIRVNCGSEFMKVDERTYTTNPQQQQDYRLLLQELLERSLISRNIVHFWGCWSKGDNQSKQKGATQESIPYPGGLESTFYSLLYLTQVLGELEDTPELQLMIVTNTMQNVAGEGGLFPEKATVLGLCRTVTQEYPHICCRSIDIVLPEKGSLSEKRLREQLVAEITFPPAKMTWQDQVVAYRGTSRWVQTFEPIRLAPTDGTSSRLKHKGVYLITGGLGGIGLTLAHYLAAQVQARLILIDLIEFPEREKREQWAAAHDEQDPLSQKIRKVQELEQLGAEVLIFQADVSDHEQMQHLIAHIEQQVGAVSGVIHSAGVPDSGIVQLKTREHVEQIFAPKVKGILVLESLLNGQTLDFFVACSSLHPFVGGVGQISATAADAFLDAFVVHKTAQSDTAIMSLNWDIWQEVGMAVDAARQGKQISFENTILPEEGVKAFHRVLENPLPHVVISPKDFSAFVKHRFRSNIQEELDDIEKTSSLSGTKSLRPELDTLYVAPQNETEQALAAIWGNFFGINQIGINDDFFDFGGDSLKAISLLSKINRKFTVKIGLREFFDVPTIEGTAAYIISKRDV